MKPRQKGKIAVDLLMTVLLVALMASGIRMSRYVFAFLPGFGSIAFARRLHLLASYWGFVLMSVHLGLHWDMAAGMLRRAAGRTSGKPALFFRCAGVGIGLYGAYAVWARRIWQYLFLQAEFVWMDPAQSDLRFFLDHLAMMACLFCWPTGPRLCGGGFGKGLDVHEAALLFGAVRRPAFGLYRLRRPADGGSLTRWEHLTK